MTIPGAYQTLGLAPALDFEAKKLHVLHFRAAAVAGEPLERLDFQPSDVRGVGTTTRMLVMAALDAVEGHEVTVKVATREEQRRLRGELSRMVRVLGGTQSEVSRMDVTLTAQKRVTVGRMYVDHFRDPLEGGDRRILGPLGWAHSAHEQWSPERGHLIYDRDAVLLAELTDEGLRELRENHCVVLQPR